MVLSPINPKFTFPSPKTPCSAGYLGSGRKDTNHIAHLSSVNTTDVAYHSTISPNDFLFPFTSTCNNLMQTLSSKKATTTPHGDQQIPYKHASRARLNHDSPIFSFYALTFYAASSPAVSCKRRHGGRKRERKSGIRAHFPPPCAHLVHGVKKITPSFTFPAVLLPIWALTTSNRASAQNEINLGPGISLPFRIKDADGGTVKPGWFKQKIPMGRNLECQLR